MYEDEEFGHRMRAYGYKQAICNSAWVYHDSGLTIESICKNDPNAKDVMEKNFDRCLDDIKSLQQKTKKPDR